jgi:starch phosphorylase
LPGWRHDNTLLRQATTVPLEEVATAHDESKQALFDALARITGRRLDPKALTLGFARRATAYKRMGLLFSDPDRLTGLCTEAGPLQVVLAGKAHPRDEGGKAGIRDVFRAAEALAPAVHVVYLPGYDMALARLLCAGTDAWLNTPRRPHEASGTSGMKAAVNGVPSVSILDGWWVEGHVEGVTGWAVGPSWLDDGGDAGTEPDDGARDAADAEDLYRILAEAVLPLYYGDPEAFTGVRRYAMALNGSYFTSQRMVADYCREAYEAEA